MKWLLRIILVISIAYCLQYSPIEFSDDFCSVIYTVIGIMFALALNQIMTFAFTEILNDKFAKNQKKRLNKIRTIYIILFTFATTAFLLKSLTFCKFEWKWVKLDIDFFIGSYLVFCLIYFIENFILLAKLKDQIDDEIRKQKREQEINDYI